VGRVFAYASSASTLFLAACMGAPELPDERRLNIADIVDRVGCEMRSVFETDGYGPDPRYIQNLMAYRAKYPKNDPKGDAQAKADYDKDPVNVNFLKGNFLLASAAAFELTLQVKDSGGIGDNAGSGLWSGIPIPAGLFSIKVTGGLNGTARRQGTFKVSLYMKDLSEWPQPNRCNGLKTESGTGIRLDGNFGLNEWIMRVMDAAKDSHTLDRFNETGTILQFTLSPSLGVTPTWNIVRPGGRKFDGVFTVGGKRDYDNTLNIVIKQVGGGPQRVFVTNWPSGMTPFSDGGGPPADTRTYTTPFRLPGGPVDPETQRALDRALESQKFSPGFFD
jgi:hypothetical protein